MERLKAKQKDTAKALKALEEILKEPFSVIVRDAAIQRFEFTFEVLWKFLKEYLNEREGIVSKSPKSCFREIFSLGFVDEDEMSKCLEMTDRRNETSHTYHEEIAKKIYKELGGFLKLMKKIFKKVSV
jgi:nucleotidyltransferase substrate binding protein (TIGR01987 family)